MKQPDRRVVVVLGTGTEIGKTHLTEACLHFLGKATRHPLQLGGRELGGPGPPGVIGLKPIESGYSEANSDAARLARASRPPLRPMPYALSAPMSPHLAAELEGVSIDLTLVRDWVEAHIHHLVFVETAGAAFSPLGGGHTNASLARWLAPMATVLVAPDRLGVLHDVTSTLVALRALAPGLPQPSIALMPAMPDASTGRNAQELHRLEIADRVVTFPHAAPDSQGCQDAARSLLETLVQPHAAH